MNKASIILLLLDWLAAIAAWIIFFSFRKRIEQPDIDIESIVGDERLLLGLMVIPIVWLLFWTFLGVYNQVYHKSRIQLIYITISGCLIGSLGLLFSVIIDDVVLSLITYVRSFSVLFLIHLASFLVFRLFIMSIFKWRLNSGAHSFNAVVFSDDQTLERSMMPQLRYTDMHTFFSVEGIVSADLEKFDSTIVKIKNRDTLNLSVPLIIGTSRDRQVFIDDESLNFLDYDYKATPFLNDDYVALRTNPLRPWQANAKRLFDIVISVFLIIILSPLLAWLYLKVKRSSPGEAIFTQERIGKHKLEFMIFKFRSMYVNAEIDGPALAAEDDERCTPFGKWMRRWRLDELPQLWNVLRGDMSLVGPRPERSFYADQLLAERPRYALLWQVKPGITSWGQIKYGYAASMPEMLKRFRFDLLYIENMSIFLDFRILFYTLIVLWQGRGR